MTRSSIEMIDCDFCEASFPYADRRVVAMKRPSDPTSMCPVMWGCGACDASKDLPTDREVSDHIERQDGTFPGVLFWEG